MTEKARDLIALFCCLFLAACTTGVHRQAKELLSRYGWTTAGQQATYRVTLPGSLAPPR